MHRQPLVPPLATTAGSSSADVTIFAAATVKGAGQRPQKSSSTAHVSPAVNPARPAAAAQGSTNTFSRVASQLPEPRELPEALAECARLAW
jgi:hypothetical protein